MTNAIFTAHEITVNGKAFPTAYSVTPNGTVFAFVTVQGDGKPVSLRIKVGPDDPNYPAALDAAQQAREAVRKPGAEPEKVEDQAVKQTQEEQPARDPKQARGPVPDKAFIGLEIKGKGWKIVFDGNYDRTRVIFKRKPINTAREAVQKAGFYWSPAMQSWNKKLTHKAFRAAQALALELRTICG